MKVFENIKASSYSNKEELTRVVSELIPLRSSETKMREYYDTFLRADYKYKVWREDREDCILNGCLDINPQYNVFTHNVGEINRLEAESFRSSLLNVLEDDKYSFAHIYNLLAQEANRRNGMVVYHCVFDSDAIDYAINFDVDELQDKLKECQDLKEKWKMCSEIMLNSSKHPYNGELKNKLGIFCKKVVDNLNTEISIFGYSPSCPKSNGMPKELNTDKARMIFQKLESCGFINIKDSGLQWGGSNSLFGYFADKVSEHLNIRPSNDRIPWMLFKSAFKMSDSSIETARQAVNNYKNKNLNEPEGYLEIKNALK